MFCNSRGDGGGGGCDDGDGGCDDGDGDGDGGSPANPRKANTTKVHTYIHTYIHNKHPLFYDDDDLRIALLFLIYIPLNLHTTSIYSGYASRT